jgi:hypothetical protein
MQLLKSGYDLDLTQRDTALYTTTFVTEYNEGAFQSGVTELLCVAKTNRKHYIVVSSVEGEA